MFRSSGAACEQEWRSQEVRTRAPTIRLQNRNMQSIVWDLGVVRLGTLGNKPLIKRFLQNAADIRLRCVIFFRVKLSQPTQLESRDKIVAGVHPQVISAGKAETGEKL